MTVELVGTEQGQGAPLVVLHGLFGAARNWSSIVQRLAARHRVIALDLRNHGGSPWADTMSYADMADDVRAALRARGIERAAWLGHSMGGKVAMIAALDHPEAVERLIAVDIAPVAYAPKLLDYVHAMQAIDPAAVSRRADADQALAPAIPDPGERSFLLQNLVLGEGARWRLNLAALERGLPDISGFPDLPSDATYPGPALFVAGARSGYVRPEHRPAIRQHFPKAHIVHVRDAGHWVHAERPEAFLRTIEPFLDGGGASG